MKTSTYIHSPLTAGEDSTWAQRWWAPATQSSKSGIQRVPLILKTENCYSGMNSYVNNNWCVFELPIFCKVILGISDSEMQNLLLPKLVWLLKVIIHIKRSSLWNTFTQTQKDSSVIYSMQLLLCYAKSLQSWPTLCDPMDHSLPGSSARGILQARILEWVVMSFSRGSSQPRDWTCIY